MSRFYFDFYFICEFSLFCPYFAPFLFTFCRDSLPRAPSSCRSHSPVTIVGKCSAICCCCLLHPLLHRLCACKARARASGEGEGERRVVRGLSLGLFASSLATLGVGCSNTLFVCVCISDAYKCTCVRDTKSKQTKKFNRRTFCNFFNFFYFSQSHARMHASLHTSSAAADRVFRQSSAHPVARLPPRSMSSCSAARKFAKNPTSFVANASTTLTTTARENKKANRMQSTDRDTWGSGIGRICKTRICSRLAAHGSAKPQRPAVAVCVVAI